MEWVLWDNDWSDGTWAPPDCEVSELVIKRQGRSTRDANCVLLSIMNVREAMSKLILFWSHPFLQLPFANNPFVIFVSIQAEKSPWFIHRSHVQRTAFYKPGLWLSDGHIGQLCAIAWHRMPLKANIYCICLLVIERLWCLSSASQSQAPPLYLPKIYSSIDSSTTLPYRLPSSKPMETSQVKGTGGLSSSTLPLH